MKMHTRNIIVCCIFAFALVLLSACDQSRLFEEWKELDKGEWGVDSTLSFTFDVADTTSVCNLLLGVRNTNMFPYRNIWLLATIEGPNSILFRDTIQIPLANNSGEWYGKRSANIYSHLAPLYTQLRFFSCGEYTVELQHGMRKDPLNGVNSIGFRVEKE